MLTLDQRDRQALWRRLIARIEGYAESIDESPVSRPPDIDALRRQIGEFDFGTPLPAEEAVDFVADLLEETQVHTAHRAYYGLFNPNPTTMGIAGDALTAAFNPQLAAWSHSPAACEIEQHLLREIGSRFGYERAELAGSFTSGGAEANHSGLLCALATTFPAFGDDGVAAIVGRPTLYVTEESHHSFAKAARLCGLGGAAVRRVEVDDRFVMDPVDLSRQVAKDRAAGARPFLVVATMGTTNAGLMDPLDAVREVTQREDLWLHADAAWGGAAALVPELRRHLGEIGRADSITFDAHKWMSVPMGAGVFLTRHDDAPRRTFSIDTDYMPVLGTGVVEPHLTTMQWSRRFIGLKVFLSLAVAGWEGYAEAIRHQTRMGDYLRQRLASEDWRVVNSTPLPTVCWNDERSDDNSIERLTAICRQVVDSGRAWISTTKIAGRLPVLRATITNYRTETADIDRLVDDLETARRSRH
jgi:glutamate/tyrosine decarboxylase-like PLP-dependent enzyme